MKEQRAVVLGGFASLGTLPCWIVRVRSRHGREWIVSVACNEKTDRYEIKYLDSIPYKDWIGSSSGRRPLIDGEVPLEMSYERMKARRRYDR